MAGDPSDAAFIREQHMTLTYVETDPISFVEGQPEQLLVQSSADTHVLIEACFFGIFTTREAATGWLATPDRRQGAS